MWRSLAPFKWADIGCVYLQTQSGTLLNFCGPKTGRSGPLDLASHLSLRVPPWKKTAPAARPGAKVSAAPPGAPPRDPRASPDHPTLWLVPPGAHHGQGGEKTAQFGPWVLPPKPKS
jgi:hypothetical protein